MSIALLIGCGNTRGEKIVKGCQQAGLSVVNIGKSQSQIPDVEHISIEWADLDIITLHKKLGQIKSKISFIFFNQNSSTLAQHNFVLLRLASYTYVFKHVLLCCIFCGVNFAGDPNTKI